MRGRMNIHELIAAVLAGEIEHFAVVPEDISRADLLKVIWNHMAPHAPKDAFDVPDHSPVLYYLDPDNPSEHIVFTRERYGDAVVIEAEGVIVCRLP